MSYLLLEYRNYIETQQKRSYTTVNHNFFSITQHDEIEVRFFLRN